MHLRHRRQCLHHPLWSALYMVIFIRRESRHPDLRECNKRQDIARSLGRFEYDGEVIGYRARIQRGKGVYGLEESPQALQQVNLCSSIHSFTTTCLASCKWLNLSKPVFCFCFFYPALKWKSKAFFNHHG